jgi:hypothetical protein
MNKRRMAKLRRELQKLRAGRYNLKTSQIVAFAGKVGRTRDTTRGKEPTYVSVLPELRPVSIPGHPTINPFTAGSILDVLEHDLDKWEELLESRENKSDENGVELP